MHTAAATDDSIRYKPEGGQDLSVCTLSQVNGPTGLLCLTLPRKFVPGQHKYDNGLLCSALRHPFSAAHAANPVVAGIDSGLNRVRVPRTTIRPRPRKDAQATRTGTDTTRTYFLRGQPVVYAHRRTAGCPPCAARFAIICPRGRRYDAPTERSLRGVLEKPSCMFPCPRDTR